MKKQLIFLAALSVCGTSHAQSAKSTVQTSFGVPVTKYSDDFAQRYEYSSPEVNFEIEGGVYFPQTAFVSYVKKPGSPDVPKIVIMVAYNGDWKRFNHAIFQGGEEIPFKESSRDVISCRGGCTMSESFYLIPTKQQIAKYGKDGNLTFQIRSQSSTTAVITMPLSYYAAVEEAARR